MTNVKAKLLAGVAGFAALGFAVTTASADQLLTGSITSATGQKLEGVQVSAKKEGSTITTNVYTDLNGDYFFPAMSDGKYRVWAQALGFQTAKGEVDLKPASAKTSSSPKSRTPRRGFASCLRKCWSMRCRRTPSPTPTSRRSSPMNAPDATRPAIRCSSSSTRPAGTRSST
jgi:hypothetical protein